MIGQHNHPVWGGSQGLQLELALIYACNDPVSPSERKKPSPDKISSEKKEAQPKAKHEAKQEGEKEKLQNTEKIVEKPAQLAEKKEPEKPNFDPEDEGIEPFWKDIRAAAKVISPETGALLNSCKTVKMKNGKIALIFSSSILLSKMDNGNNKDNARLAITQITGKELDIICEVAGKNDGNQTVNPSIDRDGMIGAALSLGGKLSKEE